MDKKLNSFTVGIALILVAVAIAIVALTQVISTRNLAYNASAEGIDRLSSESDYSVKENNTIDAAKTSEEFEYGGAYASYNPQGPALVKDYPSDPCRIVIEQCQYASRLYDEDREAFWALVDRIQREFRNAYGPAGWCGWSFNDVGFLSISCSSRTSCPGARPLIEKMINLACKSPEQREAEGIIIQDPGPEKFCPAKAELKGPDRGFGTQLECEITCGDRPPIIKTKGSGWSKQECSAETFYTCGCIQ